MLLFAARGNLDMWYCAQLSWKVMLQLARMSFIKSYKNVYLSLASYIIAYIWASIPVANTPGISNKIGVSLLAMLILAGIFFAFKSNKAKESSWAGNVLMLVGILILLLPLYAIPLVMLLDSIFVK